MVLLLLPLPSLAQNSYYGITPSSGLALDYNNIGYFNPTDNTLYTCLRIFENGVQSAYQGFGQYGVSLSLVPGTGNAVRIVTVKPFNVDNALNENNEIPDCSGILETTSGVVTDYFQVIDRTYRLQFNLADSATLQLNLTGATFVGGEGPAVPDALSLRTQYGSESTLEVATNGIFAIWWDPKFDHLADTETMFRWLNDVRADAILNLGMQDPPNPAQGYYYNIYIHHGSDDLLPPQWGNGQGTDTFGTPYLTLPNGPHLQHENLLHEGFHIFQYELNSPGFEYAGDSMWYVETSAQWYSTKVEPNISSGFNEAAGIAANPQLALWHSFSNEAPGDPTDWYYQVRQYGMHTLAFYLTEVAGVDPSIISSGFYANTTKSPQQYLYDNIGGDNLRRMFADWAAQNTAKFDYLTREQVESAHQAGELHGDPNNSHPFALELSDEQANGVIIPPMELAPRGWAYNVIKIDNDAADNYGFAFKGDAQGSEGAAAHFEVRVITFNESDIAFYEVPMSSPTTASALLPVSAATCEIYVVVASVPDHFTGNQNYDYALTISRGEQASGEVISPSNLASSAGPSCFKESYSSLLGTYVKEPYLNTYHRGTISFDGQLRWTNEGGINWALLPNEDDEWVFDTLGSPYDNTVHNNFHFEVTSAGSVVTGFYFQGQLYKKQ